MNYSQAIVEGVKIYLRIVRDYGFDYRAMETWQADKPQWVRDKVRRYARRILDSTGELGA